MILSVLSGTRLRSRCPLSIGQPLPGAAPWWLLGTCRSRMGCQAPCIQIHGVLVSSLMPGRQGHREISRVASDNLPVSCYCLGMLGWALLPSSLPSDKPSPAHAFELGSFLLLSARALRSLPISPSFLPLTKAFGVTLGPRFQVSHGHQQLSALSRRSRVPRAAVG